MRLYMPFLSIRLILLIPLVLLILLGLIACATQGGVSENPYSRTYVSRNLSASSLQPVSETPHIFLGKSKEDDYQSMLERGFDLLGYSSFEAGDVPVSQLAEQAQKVKAETVLVYTERTAQTPSSIKLQQMREKKRIEANPELAKMGKPLFTEQANYAYFASYWSKLKTPIIGIHVKSANPNTANSGLVVLAVVNDSPAQLAGLQTDDLLLRIGEMAMDKPESLFKATQQYAGETVDVVYEREGKPEKVSIQLNPRP